MKDYLARITEERIKGESQFHAFVIGTRTPGCVFTCKDNPSLQAAQQEVRDWAVRQGKTENLQWQYD